MLAIPNSEIRIAKTSRAIDQHHQLVDLFFAAFLQFLLVEDFGDGKGDFDAFGQQRLDLVGVGALFDLDEVVQVLGLAEVARHHPLGDENAAEDPELGVELADDAEARPRARLGQQREAVAEPEVIGVGEVAGDDRLAVGEVAQDLRSSLFPIDVHRLADVGRRRVDFGRRPQPLAFEQLRFGAADRRDQLDPRHRSGRFRGAVGDRRKAIGVLNHQPAGEVFVDHLGDRALQARREDGDEGDQGEADHQRRRGDRGAAGVALRVLAGEAAGEAPEPLQRPAGDRGQRRHQAGAEDRDREDDRDRAAADQAGTGAGTAAAEKAEEDHRQAHRAERQGEGEVDQATAPGRRRPEGVQGGDRRYPGRAQRRDQRGDEW